MVMDTNEIEHRKKMQVQYVLLPVLQSIMLCLWLDMTTNFSVCMFEKPKYIKPPTAGSKFWR